MTKFLTQWVCASFVKLLRSLILLTWMEWGARMPLTRAQRLLLLFSRPLFPVYTRQSPCVPQRRGFDRMTRAFGSFQMGWPCGSSRCLITNPPEPPSAAPRRGLHLDVWVSPVSTSVHLLAVMCDEGFAAVLGACWPWGSCLSTHGTGFKGNALSSNSWIIFILLIVTVTPSQLFVLCVQFVLVIS